MNSELPPSAKFCCGGLRALVQIGPNTYGVFEFGPDAQGRPNRGHVASNVRHVCQPVQCPPMEERVMSDNFWAVVDEQLDELRTATTADDVLRILSQERNPYGRDSSSADGFFAGSGGDGSVLGSLEQAGWHVLWFRADYHWAAQAPNGDRITYVEGDVYRDNRRPMA